MILESIEENGNLPYPGERESLCLCYTFEFLKSLIWALFK
jgi:hypothetical protein